MKEVAWLVKPQVTEDNYDILQLGAPLIPELPHVSFYSNKSTLTSTAVMHVEDGSLLVDRNSLKTPENKLSEIADRGDSPTFGLLMRDLSRKISLGLLPQSVQNLYNKANAWQIGHIEDVMTLRDAFRWLSWCNLVLHMLRYPASTPLLRQVLEITKSLRVIDEKIVKLLTQILHKASSWKQKARKAMSNMKKLDEQKLTSLLIEGNNLPFTSRLKTSLKKVIEGIRQPTITAKGSTARSSVHSDIDASNFVPASEDHGVPTAASTVLGKRKYHVRNSIPNSSTILADSGGVQNRASNKIEAGYHSSEDEGIVNKLISGVEENHMIVEEEIPESIRSWYKYYSYPMNVDKLLASPPNNVWPVGMTFPSSK